MALLLSITSLISKLHRPITQTHTSKQLLKLNVNAESEKRA